MKGLYNYYFINLFMIFGDFWAFEFAELIHLFKLKLIYNFLFNYIPLVWITLLHVTCNS